MREFADSSPTTSIAPIEGTQPALADARELNPAATHPIRRPLLTRESGPVAIQSLPQAHCRDDRQNPDHNRCVLLPQSSDSTRLSANFENKRNLGDRQRLVRLSAYVRCREPPPYTASMRSLYPGCYEHAQSTTFFSATKLLENDCLSALHSQGVDNHRKPLETVGSPRSGNDRRSLRVEANRAHVVE